VNLDHLVDHPRPDVTFGAETTDAVNQIGAGLHGRIEWNRRLDLSLGVQKTRYEKTVVQAGTSESMTSSPWLYQALAAWSVSPRFAVYASASNGLEESGIAPAQATNRGEVLPATITRQQEIGFRATQGPMTLTVSGFALAKPYPNLDSAGRFGFVGNIRHRGVELSLAGQPVEGLNLLAGALYLDAKVDRTLGGQEQSTRAVGQPRHRLLLSANYRLPGWKALSLDGSVTFQGDRIAKLDPAVRAPDYALVNAGIRYQMRSDLVARAELRNIFDTYGYTVSSTSAFGYVAGRTLRLAMTWTPGAGSAKK
jgi:iron complex outermembrane receptor protein